MLAVSLRAARLVYADTALFDSLHLELAAGSFTSLLGPSGVGKSSLLRLLAGLTAPGVSGMLCGGDGQPLLGRVAYMAQQDLLLPWLNVLDNVAFGLKLRGVSEAKRYEVARRFLKLLGLADFERARVYNLSGGMMGFAAAGLAPACPLCVSPHGPRFMGGPAGN